MNDEERRIISEFVARIAGATPAARPAGPWGSVPNTQSAPPLPPVDREADALIADLFARYPEARYRITQTAFVQEAAIVEMQNRIQQLEWEVENARRQGQAQAAQQKGGGLFGMFGGGGARQPQPAPMPPPPQPQYPPNYNPQMLQPQRGGMGFFGTALAGAAGVAGGMLLGNALMNAFGGHGAAQAATPASSPWSDPGAHAAAQGWGTEAGGTKSDWGGGEGDKFADAGGQSGWGNQDGNHVDQGEETRQTSWGGGSDDSNWDSGDSDGSDENY